MLYHPNDRDKWGFEAQISFIWPGVNSSAENYRHVPFLYLANNRNRLNLGCSLDLGVQIA